MRLISRAAILVFIFLSLGFSSAFAQNKKKAKKPQSSKDELLINVPSAKAKAKDTEEYMTPAAKARAAPIESKSVAPLAQFYWQAKSGQFLANPFFEAKYSKQEGTFITGTPGGIPYDVSGQQYRPGIEAEYGLFEGLSLGGRLSYVVRTTNEDIGSANGIQDLVLYTKGNWAFSSGSLHYGLHVAFSPGDRTDDGQGNNNGFTGGPSYKPYLGYSKKFSSGFAGVDLAYEYMGDKTTDTQTPTTPSSKKTLVGGHILSVTAFYEKMSESWNWGTYVGFTSESSKEFKAPNKTSPTPLEGGSNFILGTYTPMMYGDMIVTPKLEFQTFMDDQLGTSVQDVNWSILARCDVRFTF